MIYIVYIVYTITRLRNNEKFVFRSLRITMYTSLFLFLQKSFRYDMGSSRGLSADYYSINKIKLSWKSQHTATNDQNRISKHKNIPNKKNVK